MLTQSYMVQLVREALYLVLLVSAPPVLVSLVVGLVMSFFQATTQLQDQTISYVPKLVAVMLTLVLTGPWIGHQLLRFTQVILQTFPLLR